ncbi:Bifunctional NAD(P)H-hydrate repair enzyme Nnr [Candidatus Nitrosocosmicus oleophilus]|jgi:NAD(P)H-hydrate epimerase|uniref:NAD(P)H-hydrate epimerase n=2 Tax=Candidatus Nitrosocosmicus oleophilus TaxID=1353260 RepID=A0A654LY78_9ARCH|nr:Bifunctional NAD(P)H-hydrate repair enzyme Nnr [Candidatus Nitrosocosmicus oleophilus]
MDMKSNHAIEKGYESISSGQMYEIENNGESIYSMKKTLMMENAGSRIADFLIDEFKENILENSIVAVCGKGNNGGDSMVAIRHLSGYILARNKAKNKINLSVIILCSPEDFKTEESILNWQIISKMGSIRRLILDSNNIAEIEDEIKKANIILDGIFGTGIKGEIKEPYSKIIETINDNKGTTFILAVDIPSGLDPDSGKIIDKAISADATITFHRPKHGLLKNPENVGRLIVKKIGIPFETEKGVV